jgi:hypothetical protein
MKILHVIALALFPLLLTIVSCSSGNMIYYQGGGIQCAANYDPLPTDTKADGFQKVSGFNFEPGGTYTYGGMQAFFRDSSSDMKIHMALNPNADPTNTSAPTPICADGMQKAINSTPFSDSVPSVRTIVTDDDGHVSMFRYENIGFVLNKNAARALTPVNCDVSKDPHAADDPSKNPTGCGPQTGTTTIDQLYPKVSGSSLQVYCTSGDACNKKGVAKQYQIRYSLTRTPDKYPYKPLYIEVVSTMNWAPSDQIVP